MPNWKQKLTRTGVARARPAGAALLTVATLATGTLWARDAGAPQTERRDVSDSYFNVTVMDPYRWLEDASDPRVSAWSASQDQRTRRYLDGLPARQPIYDRLYAQISASSPSYYRLQLAGGRLFAFFNQPPKQQPMIAVMGPEADPAHAHIVLDPNALNPSGTTAIDWYVASPDGSLLAVSLSENGSEDGTLHLFDVATGKERPDVITRVNYPTGGGSLAWRADSKGFWYTRYPGPDRPREEQHFYQRLYFHVLGQEPSADALVLGDGLPKIAEIALGVHHGSDVVVVTVANGDGGEFAHYLLDDSGRPRQVTHFEDGVVFATVSGDSLYLVSYRGAPHGRVLSLAVADPVLARARELVPQSEAVIVPGGEFGGEPVVATHRALYVREIVGGPSRVAVFDLEGHQRGELPLPGPATVEELVPLPDGSLLYDISTYLRPPYFARYDEGRGTSSETALAQTSPVSFQDAEALRRNATSKDGTRVPLNIIRRKGTVLDGHNPVLLTGYGGYAVSLAPAFVGPRARLWLDAGGVFVIANLRGGGEYGEQWHHGGNLTHKQNVFDDFAAAARYLISAKYTTADKLAIIGGSNGGLLMGASFTQHPELYRAVVSLVGIYDMLRIELDPNGAFNTTEFGSVRDRAQFAALYAYSPYHHVIDGTKYPAIFMATGETDGRVNPAHSRKMIARLQAATSGGPVYLSTNAHAGHGIGSALSIRVGQWADEYAFLFDQLGLTVPVRRDASTTVITAH
jgi:prolyl oligopeptidase